MEPTTVDSVQWSQGPNGTTPQRVGVVVLYLAPAAISCNMVLWVGVSRNFRHGWGMRMKAVTVIGLLLGSSVVLSACGVTGLSTTLTIGAHNHPKSKLLNVSGTKYEAGKTLYARLQDAQNFGTSTLSFMIQKKAGSGWTMVNDQSMTVDPADNVEVWSFYVVAPGRYEVSIISGNKQIASHICAAK